MTSQSGKREKILVIDDNQTVLVAIRAILEDAGFEVATADRAIGASAIVIREKPDLVLMDLVMPLSGSVIVSIMRSHSTLKDTKVVMFSSRPLEELKAAAEKCGADGYIQKSCSPEIFVNQIKIHLSRNEKRDKIMSS